MYRLYPVDNVQQLGPDRHELMILHNRCNCLNWQTLKVELEKDIDLVLLLVLHADVDIPSYPGGDGEVVY